MTFTKILCPIDFSPCSRDAMRVAVRIATESDAELVLAHAWHLPPAAYAEQPLPSDVLQVMMEHDQRGLVEVAHEATALGAKRVTTRFLTGVPRDQIVDVLRGDHAFDLVVMGTHGRTGFARILLGSVTEMVVRHAPCTVMAIRAGSRAKQFEHVLCPIDFSDRSRHAVALAAELAWSDGAGITLLHVVETPVTYAREPVALGFIEDRATQSAQLLAQWAAELKTKVAVPVTTRSRFGSPAAQTLALLDEDPTFDLVVTGSHNRTGMRRVLLGSVAENVVRHAGCPVVVARPRAD